MSHFYGIVSGGRGDATRCGHKTKGLTTTAASWNGAIRTTLFVDDGGRDCYRVEQIEWQGRGAYRLIAEGCVGESPAECYAREAGVPAEEVPF